MEENVTIWSPVLLSRLRDSRRLAKEKTYPLESSYQAMEDLRIRIRERQVVALGTAVEARLKLDLLCLLEDSEGHMHLFKREETFNDRIPLLEFDRAIERDGQIDYRLEIKGLAWEGEINGHDIRVSCFIDYTVIATREQLVRLQGEERVGVSGELLSEAMRQLELEVERIQGENAELKRQLFYHASNISSLKQGLQKAEKRNAALNRENTAYQVIVDKMRQELASLGRAVGMGASGDGYYANRPVRGEYKIISATEAKAAGAETENPGLNQLGSRIKRMFQNNQ